MPPPSQPPAGWWSAAARAVARRPGLWPIAVSQALRSAEPGWWRRRPFLPLPAPDYLRFRMETQYGTAPPDPDDVVTYLRWCRDMRRLR